MPINPSSFRLKHRRTKIVATIGPATNDFASITALIDAGVNVFRVNMSHGDHSTHKETIETIRTISERKGLPIAILADLCGPKIRIGEIDGAMTLTEGEEVTITTREVKGEGSLIPSRYPHLSQDVEVGQSILLADGHFALEVLSKSDDEVQCKVLQGGKLTSNKGMNLPGSKLSIPSLTDKDKADAAFALEQGVDALALSFVRKASDVDELRALCLEQVGSAPPLIAKIEKPEALDEIEEILQTADGIMVARGDLGVELPPEQVPAVQDQLVRLARRYNRPAIVATQMLESMIENARPTRAEVSDVAHAVATGVDAVMLSGETAVGKHPMEAVQTMDRIARQTEGDLWSRGAFHSIQPGEKQASLPLPVPDAIGNATALLSRELRVRAIVVPSTTGTTLRIVSASRPAAPLVALTHEVSTFRRASLLWGAVPMLVSQTEMAATTKMARALVRRLQLAETGHTILLVEGFHPEPQRRAPSMTVLKM